MKMIVMVMMKVVMITMAKIKMGILITVVMMVIKKGMVVLMAKETKIKLMWTKRAMVVTKTILRP